MKIDSHQTLPPPPGPSRSFPNPVQDAPPASTDDDPKTKQAAEQKSAALRNRVARSVTLQIGDRDTTGSIQSPSTTLVFSPNVQGCDSLVRMGSDTSIRIRNNAYAGTSGSLQLGNGGDTGSFEGNLINHARLIFNRATDHTVRGIISGTGEVIHAGSGTTTLKNDHLYFGPTFINAGHLVAEGNLATASVLIENGSRFTTKGWIVGNVINSGIFHPVTSAYDLNKPLIGNDYVQNSGAKMVIGFYRDHSSIPEITSDQVIVAGRVRLDGTLKLEFSSGVTPSPGQEFTILTTGKGRCPGEFSSVESQIPVRVDYSHSDVKLRFT